MDKPTGATAKTKHAMVPKGRLIVDLVGPYVVHFMTSGVNVYAPPCVSHYANVLTDLNDIPLYGLNTPTPVGSPTAPGYIYELQTNKGFHGNAGSVHGLDDGHNQYLVLKPNEPLIPKDAAKCHLIFQLPIPNQVFPLVPEWVFIHKGKAALWLDSDKDPSENYAQTQTDQSQFFFGRYARALRLIYLDCSLAPKLALVSYPPSAPIQQIEDSLGTFCPTTVGFDPGTFHFTLRFASNGPEPDDNHQDAYNCFQTMRTLISDTSAWRVDFDNVHVPGENIAQRSPFEQVRMVNHSSNPPVDCHAAVLVVQDPS